MQVLYVDDHKMNRRMICEMLSSAGVHSAQASDALEGLAMIEAGDFDCVLMDLRMSGMDGLEAVRRIRARKDAKSRVPIIMLTADMAPGLAIECLGEGADDFLTKPFVMQALFDAVGRSAARMGALVC